MKLLVVKDESRTSEYLQQGLSEAGFVVDLAHNGLDGQHLATTGDYNLLIPDVMLSSLERWQVPYTLHSTELAVPVLFLTARDSVANRVKGLELGVDDYMVEPSALAKLLTRIRTLLRRGSALSLAERIQMADLVLNLTRRRALHGGQRITLTSKKFSPLELLARRRGEVLPRFLTTSQIWDMNFDNDANVIDVAIRRLHAKVNDDFEPKLVHTVRGIGYVLEGPENGE